MSLLLTAFLVPACASANVGGFDYALQYDFSEFYAATNNKTFQVIVSGNPFPTLSDDDMRRRLLPVMQVNRPRPRLTFTYTPPAEEPHPDYRLVLVFDAANDLTAQRVCAGQYRQHKPNQPGRVSLFAVYCRNNEMMSQAVSSARGSAPEDPDVNQMFHDLFLVLFTDQPMRLHRENFPFILR